MTLVKVNAAWAEWLTPSTAKNPVIKSVKHDGTFWACAICSRFMSHPRRCAHETQRERKPPQVTCARKVIKTSNSWRASVTSDRATNAVYLDDGKSRSELEYIPLTAADYRAAGAGSQTNSH